MAPIGASFLTLIGWSAPGPGALTRLMNAVTSQRNSYPLQRAAQQLLGSGELAERRRRRVGAVIQIEVAALI